MLITKIKIKIEFDDGTVERYEISEDCLNISDVRFEIEVDDELIYIPYNKVRKFIRCR
jgi:hypothetical protein